MPRAVAQASHYKLDQIAPVAQVDDLIDYDAVIFGTSTRYGNMAAQMKNFIDQTGSLWAKDKLVGKVGSVFTATATCEGCPGNDAERKFAKREVGVISSRTGGLAQ